MFYFEKDKMNTTIKNGEKSTILRFDVVCVACGKILIDDEQTVQAAIQVDDTDEYMVDYSKGICLDCLKKYY